MAVDPQSFKSCLRRWASGVSIVTTRCGDRVLGMTVSAFSSVSLDPPLVLVCADKSSHTQPLIDESRVFAVNVLAEDQEDLSNRFATTGNEAVRFEGIETGTGPTGAPWLPGSLVVLDCRVVADHDAGDHVVYIGEVVDAHFTPDRAPLLYYNHRYHTLAPSE